MTAIDEHDAWADDRDEARTATAHAPQEPRPGSRADAIERGFDPRDEFEDMP